MSTIKSTIHKSLRIFGLDLIRYCPPGEVYPPDFSPEEIEIVRKVRSWTMTTPERIFALIQATRYVILNGIPGAIVECGVWKGGSMAAIARTLLQLQDMSRDLYLFDTFQGMTEPTTNDVEYSGKHASMPAPMRPSKRYKKSSTRQAIPGKKSTLCLARWRKPFRLPHRIRSRYCDSIPTGMSRLGTN